MLERLDVALVRRKLIRSRSQAESYIKLGKVKLNGKIVKKPSALVNLSDNLRLDQSERYVSRAGFKLASVVAALGLDFRSKTVLDVGSSTGGFTDYALQRGATKVIAVDVGSHQLHPSLRGDKRIELHEKTDIREFRTNQSIDIVVADVSFISLRQILPAIAGLVGNETNIVVMVKPQFEAGTSGYKHKGVIKNERLRRDVLKDFEKWAQQDFAVIAKSDSKVSGEKGNLERFYLLRKLTNQN